MQNVGGLCSDVEPSGRDAELDIDIGCFDLRRGGGRTECEAHPAFVDPPNDPLSNKTLWGWKLTLIILSGGVKGLCALVPECVAFRVAERFITARFRLS